jgi:hypothetical protein
MPGAEPVVPDCCYEPWRMSNDEVVGRYVPSQHLTIGAATVPPLFGLVFGLMSDHPNV